jgi:putative tricarboxylic transport membrane protein
MNIKKDRLLGTITLILGLLVIVGAMSLPKSNLANDPGPAIFPVFGSLLIIGGSIAVILQKQKPSKPFLKKEQWKRLWTLFFLFVLYAIGLWLVGFIIATILILFVLSTLFAEDNHTAIWKRILFSLLVTMIVFFLFEKGLSLLLPNGIIF